MAFRFHDTLYCIQILVLQMVSRPEQFDVMVLPNLYGNIIANIATGLVGGAGVVAGVNVGEKYAVFELVFPAFTIGQCYSFSVLFCTSKVNDFSSQGTRNTGKKIAGKNVANPAAMLKASCELLGHIG